MSPALRRYRLALRFHLALIAAVLVTALSVQLATGAALFSVLRAALFSLPVALLLGWSLVRGVRTVIVAVADGLLSFRERDFGYRLAVSRKDELGLLIDRFNVLGHQLRAERNVVYQKEVLLSTVLEAAPVAILIHDEAELIILDNGAARDLLADGRQLAGRTLDALWAESPPELRAALSGGEDVLFSFERGGEIETYHASRRYFEINTEQHTLLLVKPLTRELTRQEIDVWKKTIRLISHELNNSLAPISSLVHSAQKIVDRPEHAQKLGSVFGTIEERIDHLKTFLEGYARFARLPAPEKQSVDWRPFLERLRPLYPFALPERWPPSPGFFDPGQIEQVLINLLKNAVEAGGPAEEVRLAIEENVGLVQIEVLDRGSGMTDEVLRQALLPFFTTKASGSGLGLPLAREIVEAHGGKLRIERRDGGGTRVCLLLP